MAIVHLNDSSFTAEVLEEKGGVLVDFFAIWCGPCKMLTPVLEELADREDVSFKICKVDIDQCPEIARAAEITVVPTLIFFKDGQAVHRAEGYLDDEEILEIAAEKF